jgi:hypothetical protein
MKKRSGTRYLVVDGERQSFNLFGPTHDDGVITRSVGILQSKGRSIYIQNEERTALSDAEVISDAEVRLRMKYMKDPLI